IVLDEDAVPVRDEVRGACELLALDPLHIANEGQLVAVVDGQVAERALDLLRATPGGEAAAIVGHVELAPACTIIAAASYAGSPLFDMLAGHPLPRNLLLHASHPAATPSPRTRGE